MTTADKAAFSKWIVGDINSNIKRAWLAEYLVDCALGANTLQHMQWSDFDVKLGNYRIEVKASGFISPPWPITRFSKNPRFDIEPRKNRWCEDSNKRVNYSGPTRPADIYIFCLHSALNEVDYDPFDLTQWQFASVRTVTLARELGEQKSISWTKAKSLGSLSLFHTLQSNVLRQSEEARI